MKYSVKFVNEGIIILEDFVSMKEKINNIMEEEFTALKDYVLK